MNFKNNPLVKLFYSILFYFELGRGTASRFYGWLPECIVVVGGLKYLMGWELSKTSIVLSFIGIAVLMFLAGLFVKKTGLYDADRYVQASKDPVTNELLQAARKK